MDNINNQTNNTLTEKDFEALFKPSKKVLRKERREYYKAVRKARKRFKKMIKEWYPHDYYYTHELLCAMIEEMKTYYQRGYNVFQVDSSRYEIIDSMRECLSWNERAKDVWLRDSHDWKENNDYESECYKKLYEIIGKNILTWWD